MDRLEQEREGTTMNQKFKNQKETPEVAHKLLLAVTGKGGGGKSVTSAALVCALSKLNISYKAVDLDLSNSTFHRTAGAELIECDGISGIGPALETIAVETLVHSNTQALVLDFGDGSINELRRMCSKDDLVQVMMSCGVETVVIHVFDPSLDCITNLIDTAEAAADATHLVLMNYGMTKTANAEREFMAITENREFQQMSRGMHIIVMPAQADLSLLDAQGLRLCDIDTSTHPLTRNPMLMHRVRKWLELLTNEFNERLQLRSRTTS